MITKEIAAVLALYVYDEKITDPKKLPVLPYEGWNIVENPLLPTGTDGFAYRVFRNAGTGEVVISYRGTDGAGGFLTTGDGSTNAGAYWAGSATSQVIQAAIVYATVQNLYGQDRLGSNISFTGHSLGGGLASIMAVWFDRPAIVFDPAPFAATAQSMSAVTKVLSVLGGSNAPPAFFAYDAEFDYFQRAPRVTEYFAIKEFLEPLRS